MIGIDPRPLDAFLEEHAVAAIAGACRRNKVASADAAEVLWAIWRPHFQFQSARALGKMASHSDQAVGLLHQKWKREPLAAFQKVALTAERQMMVRYHSATRRRIKGTTPSMMGAGITGKG